MYKDGMRLLRKNSAAGADFLYSPEEVYLFLPLIIMCSVFALLLFKKQILLKKKTQFHHKRLVVYRHEEKERQKCRDLFLY